jgi:hypothetical protein
MVIACPLENVTVYPELVESSPSTSASTTASAHSLSTRNRNKFPFQNRGAKKAGSKKIYKRCDFDFSHNGTPLFEFNSNTMSQWKGELPPFLEVGELGPFYDGDEYEMMDDREYAEMVKEGMGKGLDWMGQEIEGERKVVSPFAGQWWKVFYEGVSRDAARWCSIRSAMSRGKCRVVVRYTEFEDDYEGQDVEMEGGLFGLGIDLEGSAGGFEGGEGKKIKERLVGRQRLTRSETRRRSGLGMSEVSSSGVVIGVGSAGNGLGESGRSRAVGNTELGASVGKGGKGKGVVKK